LIRKLGRFLRDVWFLSAPYFSSEERWSARGLLGIILVMNFSLVGLSVVLNFWSGAFMNALQSKDAAGFAHLLLTWEASPEGFLGIMPGFVAIATAYIAIAIYRTYLRQLLQIRWRRWLTARLQTSWLTDRAYYRLQLQNSASTTPDNPDQRIADDAGDFVDSALVLGLDFISKVVSIFSFVSILWALSGPARIFGITIPGYMVWVALIYSIAGTLLTQWVGYPLVRLNVARQRVEADFRFALVRLRENAEGVALYGGEADEARTLVQRFASIYENWRRIMTRTKALNGLIAGYEQVASIFGIVVAAPRYFAGQISFGQVSRVAGAFGEVQEAMSWIVNRYGDLADWAATVERLATFQHTLEEAHKAAAAGIAATVGTGPDLVVRNLRLNLPDGTTLVENGALHIQGGSGTVIRGPSGAGKSTLFRALAGIWPFGGGVVERPAGTVLFLPQRPYIPLGTLRRALSYPADVDAYPDAEAHAALTDAGLAALIPELDLDSHWAQRLSGGEQQRLALARALLTRPDWLFLDEATASLDPAAEADLYRILRERLPQTTVVSIAHRPEVIGPQDQQIIVENGTYEVRQPGVEPVAGGG
jgi:vitamin B12/bleomycin/antimicrobial peptide transport system ATP-binding/permease protein